MSAARREGAFYDELPTPSLLVDAGILECNVSRMQAAADAAGVALRPHFKAHRSIEVLRLQQSAGARGFAVATPGEAEALMRFGVGDIQVARVIMDPASLAALSRMRCRARVALFADSVEAVAAIGRHFDDEDGAEVFVEVDSGLARSGVAASAAAALPVVDAILGCRGLRWAGIATHAGQVYRADAGEVSAIGRGEGEAMVRLAEELAAAGRPVPLVSVGSSPTALHAAAVAGVGEIRPGTYVLNDGNQVALGVCAPAGCAATVLTTVIGVLPGRVVVDAGSKALALDRGAHGRDLLPGYGRVVGTEDHLSRLSEEHGVIDDPRGSYHAGQKLLIVPNHICPVVNLHRRMFIIRDDSVVDTWPILARR